MNTATIISVLVTLAQAFFSKNPTVEEIVTILPELGTALGNAKAGAAFSVSIPESIDGKPGTSTFSWSPN